MQQPLRSSRYYYDDKAPLPQLFLQRQISDISPSTKSSSSVMSSSSSSSEQQDGAFHRRGGEWAKKPAYNEDDARGKTYNDNLKPAAAAAAVSRRRPRTGKIFNPGPLGSFDNEDNSSPLGLLNNGSKHPSRMLQAHSRGKSIDAMRMTQRSFDVDQEQRPRKRNYDDCDDDRKRQADDYDPRVIKRKASREVIDVDAIGDDDGDAAKRDAYDEDVDNYQRPENRWKRDSYDDDDQRREPNGDLGYSDHRDRNGSEASRVFPGYSGRRSQKVSSFTNKPVLSAGSFPAVVSLRRQAREEEDEDFDDFYHSSRTHSDISRDALRSRPARRNRYDAYDELPYRARYEDELTTRTGNRGLPARRRRRRRQPLEQDYSEYDEDSYDDAYRRRAFLLEDDDYLDGTRRGNSRYNAREMMYAPEERLAQRRRYARDQNLLSNRRIEHALEVPLVPEAVTIISGDSKGSRLSTRASPVGDPGSSSSPKRPKKAPLQLPKMDDRSSVHLLDQPILLEQRRRHLDEDEESPWGRPNRPRGAAAAPLGDPVTFDFCLGKAESPVESHILIMPAEDYELNPIVTKLMMEDHAYTVYPFKRRELLNYALAGDLEAICKAVVQMIRKSKKDSYVRVEFIGHDRFLEGRPISLVVGTAESYPVAQKRLIKEGNVVTIVTGTFKGEKGVVKVIRDDKLLLAMHENGSNVVRWIDHKFLELMDDSQLLTHLVLPKPQSHDTPANHRELDTLLLNPSCSMDSEMMSALQNDLFIDGSPPENNRNAPREAQRPNVQNDDILDKNRTPLRGRKNSCDTRDFLADMEDHLDSSFDPDLYHMLHSDKLGTPRPYDDGTSFLSPLLRDSRYVDEVDRFGSRPSSAVPLQSPATTKGSVNASTLPSVPSLKRDDEDRAAASQVSPSEPRVADLQQPKHDTGQLKNAEISHIPSIAKIHSKAVEEEELLSKSPAVEQSAEQTTEHPTRDMKPAAVDYLAVATAAVGGTSEVEKLGQTPKKRKSVPALDFLDRRKYRTNSEATLPLPRLTAIDDGEEDIPPSIEKKVNVNAINESAISSRASPALNNDALDSIAPDATAVEQNYEEGEIQPSVKRGRGRPKKCRDRDTSSAMNFLLSMSVLELKDKLRRMKVSSSGTRMKLFSKLTTALMIDENTPLEALPDVITRNN